MKRKKRPNRSQTACSRCDCIPHLALENGVCLDCLSVENLREQLPKRREQVKAAMRRYYLRHRNRIKAKTLAYYYLHKRGTE